MNYKDQEQVGVFRRYLLDRADRSRSGVMRAQIRRWVEWVNAVENQDRNRRQRMKKK